MTDGPCAAPTEFAAAPKPSAKTAHSARAQGLAPQKHEGP